MLWTIFEQPLPRVILTVFGTAVTQTSNAGQPSVVKSSQDVNLPFKRNTKESCNASRPWAAIPFAIKRALLHVHAKSQTTSCIISRVIAKQPVHLPPTCRYLSVSFNLTQIKKKKKMIVRPFR